MDSNLHNHIHHKRWIINWKASNDSRQYEIWIDDPEGDCCFEYKECLNLEMGIEFCRLSIDSIINQNTLAMFNLFAPLSTYINSLSKQINRMDRTPQEDSDDISS